jgi:hypothetical protein
VKRSKKGRRELDRRIRDYEETRANQRGKVSDGAYTCPGRVKLK